MTVLFKKEKKSYSLDIQAIFPSSLTEDCNQFFILKENEKKEHMRLTDLGEIRHPRIVTFRQRSPIFSFCQTEEEENTKERA